MPLLEFPTTMIWRHLGFPNWDSFETPFGTILRHFSGQLWDTFWDNFGTALINLLASVETELGQLLDNFGTTLVQLSDSFGTTFWQPWDNFGIILGQLWDKIRTAFRHFLDKLAQLSDNFETILRQLLGDFRIILGWFWDNSETTLGPHGDYVVTIGSTNICPVDRTWPFFTEHFLSATLCFHLLLYMLLINCYPQGKVKKNKTLLLCNIHHHHHPHQDVFSSVFRSTPSLFSPSPPRPSSSSSPLQSITRQKISNLCLETTPFLSDPGKLSHALSYMWFVCTGYYKCICQCFYRTQVRSYWRCLSVTHHWLTDSLTYSCLVNLIDVTLACQDVNLKLELVTVPDVDDGKRVGDSWVQIWKLKFGQKLNFSSGFK